MEKITFRTKDGVTIVGNYFKSQGEHALTFLLLHMMPSTKESWNDFAALLQKGGFDVLAIDLRGHGESINKNGTRINYKEFRDEEHRESIQDIAAAKEFLRERGVDTSRLGIAGASIGANLALQWASMDKDVKLLILLSAGVDYRGIKTPELAGKYKNPVYILASEKDSRNAAQSSRILFGLFHCDKKLNIIQGDSHGTDMFSLQPDLMEEIMEWIAARV